MRKAGVVFALLLSAVLLLGGTISGTLAYTIAVTPPVHNVFVYDANNFDPIPTPGPTPAPPVAIDLPDTGDHQSMALWCMLLAVSTASLVCVRRKMA